MVLSALPTLPEELLLHLPKDVASDRAKQHRISLVLLGVATLGFLWSLSHVLSFDVGLWWSLSVVFTVLNAVLVVVLARPFVRQYLGGVLSKRSERLAAERNRRSTEWMHNL